MLEAASNVAGRSKAVNAIAMRRRRGTGLPKLDRPLFLSRLGNTSNPPERDIWGGPIFTTSESWPPYGRTCAMAVPEIRSWIDCSLAGLKNMNLLNAHHSEG